MKEVSDDFKETKTTGKYDEKIFGAEEIVEILLELLKAEVRIVLVIGTNIDLPEAATASRVVESPRLA